MFRFLHAADIHLDSAMVGLDLPEDTPLDQVRGATRRAFDNLVDLAIREQVAFVLLSGDLYDGDWKDFNTGIFFNRRVAQLKDARIAIYIVTGNHDAASQITKSLKPLENVHFFSHRKPETILLKELDVALHGQSFASRAVTDDLSANYPKAKSGMFNIGLLHTALSGREGHEPYAPCTVDGLKSKGYQYWALGHVHQREIVSEDPWIVFPGNIQGRHVRETGSKGCTLVTVDGDEVKVESADLDILRWNLCQVDVGGCNSTDEVCERVQAVFEKVLLEAEDRPLLARLELLGATAAHQQLKSQTAYWAEKFRGLAAGIGGSGIWLEKVKLKTTDEVRLETLTQGDDALAGLLKNLMDLEIDAGKISELDLEFSSFLSRLPAEIRGGEDPFDPTDPDQWNDIRNDIKDLLVARLLSAGERK